MKKLVISSALSIICTQPIQASASDFNVVGTIPTVVKSHQELPYVSFMAPKPNIVLLQKIQLSNQAQKAFANRINKIKASTYTYERGYAVSANQLSKLPSAINLGMNGVPVLNQGMHGSCVTFAIAASIDSLISKGDYISELCSLTLGNALAENNPYYPTGWNGSIGPIVLNQFFTYGIVPKTIQETVGCGGLKSYPAFERTEEGMPTSPKEYQAMSESISNKFEWHTLFNSDLAFTDENFSPEKVLEDVKKTLNDNNRVSFGVLLDVAQGSVGAVGTINVKHDTWMLTPEIEEDVNNAKVTAGHEMLIIGYDDDVVVGDDNGHENKGILTLRNSWSEFAGDHGNYYMSYDHFKLMVSETQYVKAKQ